jgi:hypothetical protein
VAYRALYPGIDMVYGGEGRDLKSEFVVAPGADPSRIRVRYAGAGGVRIEEDGALAIPVDGRELHEQAPSICQERRGERVAVEGRFAVDGDGTVRFVVGDCDVTRPLIIDPVLSYSTLLGGSGFNTATALAVDSAGAAYVVGFTESYNFPTAHPEQSYNAGGNDVFVAKFNPSGSGFVYCTYVGGSADDRAYGIAVDGNGFAYVTGSTNSANFPVRNALQSRLAGGRNAFVTTPPDAWSYAALLPFAEEAAMRLTASSAIPAAVEVDLTVVAGEVGVCVVHRDFKQISGERLVRAKSGPQRIWFFIPDIRERIGLMCRNGQSNETVSSARISRVALLLPR